MAKKDKTKGKDLKPSKPVKGGRLIGNDNQTLVRKGEAVEGSAAFQGRRWRPSTR